MEIHKLLEVLREIKDDVDFERETALVDEGLIDSLDLTQIIAGLDEAFGVHITTADIEPENFNSAEAMLALVRPASGAGMTRCVLDWLDAAAERAPEALAFEASQGALTWAEVRARARQIGSAHCAARGPANARPHSDGEKPGLRGRHAGRGLRRVLLHAPGRFHAA